MLPDVRDHPVFICGHPKAGTSLLRAALDSHPQLIVYPEETVFFRRCLPQMDGLDLEGRLELAERTLIHIFKWDRERPDPSQAGFPDRDYREISYDAVRRVMRELVQDPYRHPGDLLSGAVLAYGRVSGVEMTKVRHWVEKSPYNEYYAEVIFNWWPEARCVHILRDPRDNFTSYRRKHPDWTPEFFSANWRRSTQAGMRNLERFGKQRYLFVRFEDLARSPEDSLERLTGFLGIDWDVSLLTPSRAGEQWGGNSMFEEQFEGISAAPVERWKSSLSFQEADVITLMNRPLLKTWEYPSKTSGSITGSFSARWRTFTWPVRRTFTHRVKGAQSKSH
jgi:hypothetical protein